MSTSTTGCAHNTGRDKASAPLAPSQTSVICFLCYHAGLCDAPWCGTPQPLPLCDVWTCWPPMATLGRHSTCPNHTDARCLERATVAAECFWAVEIVCKWLHARHEWRLVPDQPWSLSPVPPGRCVIALHTASELGHRRSVTAACYTRGVSAPQRWRA